MKKKVLSLIMATTMVAGLVTGCGDSSKTASNNSSADTAAVDTSSADNTAEADTS